MATTPFFYGTPGSLQRTTLPATANTNTDGTGTITEIAAGSASPGKLVSRVWATGHGTTAANRISLFHSSDGGTTWRFITDVLLPALTPSTTVRVQAAYIPELTGLKLVGTNEKLGAAPHAAAAANLFVESASS